MGALAVLTRPFHRRPVVLSVRGSDILGPGSLVRRVTAWAVRRCDAVIANAPVSHRAAAALRTEAELCRCIPNGLTLPPMEELTAARARRTGGRPVNVVSVGRLVRERRHDLLVRATARIRRTRPAVTLTLVGDGPERAALERLVGQLGLRPAVRLVGQVPHREVSRYLTEADMYVSATEADNFANAVLEGAAHALPVVVTRVGFPAEVVVDGRTGYLVEPGDEEGLYQAMLKLVDDPAQRRGAGLAMRRRVEELGLTWSECAARTLEVYQAVLERKGRAASSSRIAEG
jgi:glycosyltransferase involved in cell wall biosynthesis